MKKTDYKKISKIIILRYIVIVILIVLISIFRLMVSARNIDQMRTMSTVINVAGRQRMLSQKIAKDANILAHITSVNSKAYYINEMKISLGEWYESNDDLINRNSAKELEGENSQEIMKLFEENKSNFTDMYLICEEILAEIDNIDFSHDIIMDKIYSLLEKEGNYVNLMQEIVDQYNYESLKTTDKLLSIERVLYFIQIIILLATLFVVLIPSERYFRKSFLRIQESNKDFEKIFQFSDRPLFLFLIENFKLKLASEEGIKLLEEKIEDATINSLNIISIDKEILKLQLEEEERIKKKEIVISKNDETLIFSLSSTKIKYMDKDSILVSLYDITKEKISEENLRNLSIKDKLTGAYNRNFLEEKIHDEMERAIRYNFYFSIMIFDLDFFKKVNDNFGHLMGDEILTLVVKTAKANIRSSDYLIRYGGEEFLVLMPHTRLREAKFVAEKIRKEIERLNHPIVGKITASFGVAKWDGKEYYKELTDRADKALYEAKNNGRNRVEIDKKNSSSLFDEEIEWKEEWNSGNRYIDFQHQELFKKTNKFMELTYQKISKEDMLKNLDNIIKMILVHFEQEERILIESRYTHHLEHHNIHQTFIKEIYKNREKYVNDEMDAIGFLQYILEEVLGAHMLDDDTKFFPFVNKTEDKEV